MACQRTSAVTAPATSRVMKKLLLSRPARRNSIAATSSGGAKPCAARGGPGGERAAGEVGGGGGQGGRGCGGGGGGPGAPDPRHRRDSLAVASPRLPCARAWACGGRARAPPATAGTLFATGHLGEE